MKPNQTGNLLFTLVRAVVKWWAGGLIQYVIYVCIILLRPLSFSLYLLQDTDRLILGSCMCSVVPCFIAPQL